MATTKTKKSTKTKVKGTKRKAKATKPKASKTKGTKKTTKKAKTKAPAKEEKQIPWGTDVPHPPKSKLNAYTYFVADRRPKLRKKNPELTFKELTQKVADEWKALTDEKKKKYMEKSAEDAERYKADVEEWEAAVEEAGFTPRQVRRYLKEVKERKKIPKGPTKPRSPYAFFMMTMHKELAEDMDFTERTQTMSRKWKELDEDGKTEYVEKSHADKDRYEKELKEFLEEHPEALKYQPKKRKRIKEEGEPKRAKTAYIFYTMDQRPKVKEANPEMESKDIMRELGKMWKKLSESKKRKYNDMAHKDSKRYKREKKEWLESRGEDSK